MICKWVDDMMFGRQKRITFSQAVEATHWLLVTVGEHHWARYFAKFRSGQTAGFESAYGGMGSFNDLVICRSNKHQIETSHEPLANQLLQRLSSISYATSRRGALTAPEALKECGTVGHELQGWRCRECGHSQVSPAGLNAFAAYCDTAMAIQNGISSDTFLESIQTLWAQFNSDDNVSRFRADAERSGIHFSENTGWMRPCPKCGSNDTCVYRWDFDIHGFDPSRDNLEIKRR